MTADDSPPDRTLGIEFGEFNEQLQALEYPATTEDVIESYGEHELTLPSGPRSVRAVLEPLLDTADGVDPAQARLESPEEARQMILNAVGSDAVGREEYTDREFSTRGGEEYRDEETL